MKDGMKLDGATREGLIEVLRERAQRPDDDVIMQALTIIGGAQAIGCERPCAPRRDES